MFNLCAYLSVCASASKRHSQTPRTPTGAQPPEFGILLTMRTFDSLTEREILALAIAMEEEDERVYADYAYDLKQDFPSTAASSTACARRNRRTGGG